MWVYLKIENKCNSETVKKKRVKRNLGIQSEIEGERVGKLGGNEVCVPPQLEAESQHSGLGRKHRHEGGSNPVDGEHHVARAETAACQHGTSVSPTQRK